MRKEQNDPLTLEVAYKNPDEFESLGHTFEVEEYTIRDGCLILNTWDEDEIFIPMCEILYFIVVNE